MTTTVTTQPTSSSGGAVTDFATLGDADYSNASNPVAFTDVIVLAHKMVGTKVRIIATATGETSNNGAPAPFLIDNSDTGHVLGRRGMEPYAGFLAVIGNVTVIGQETGLTPGTTYHFRLRAQNVVAGATLQILGHTDPNNQGADLLLFDEP